MKYVIIGNSGHYPQVLEAMRNGETCAPCAVAPGSRAEDVRALAEEIAALTRRQQRGKGMRMV